VVGLELGADDYITKPFDVDVLLARIKTALRHTDPVKPTQFQTTLISLGDLSIDLAARQVTAAGKQIELTRREFDLLHALASRPNQVLAMDELLAQVWGAEFEGQPQAVYVHIRWLREKIEADPEHPQRIISVRGVGYKLQVSED
jgi:DNA-binding response OmpR family regulator